MSTASKQEGRAGAMIMIRNCFSYSKKRLRAPHTFRLRGTFRLHFENRFPNSLLDSPVEMEGQIIGCPNASKNNATFSIRWNLFEDDIPEEWAISTYPSNNTVRNNLDNYITRFEESKQPPPRQEEELPPPPAMFQEQLSPAPAAAAAAAAAAAISSPSQPAGSRSNRHRTPSTAERISRQMELRTHKQHI